MIAGVPGAATLRATGWDDLGVWSEAPLLNSAAAFLRSASAMAAGAAALRPAYPAPARLLSFCRHVAAMPDPRSEAEARRFFEAHFAPSRIGPPGTVGFLTGYYEPVVAGSLTPGAGFAAPVLAWPEQAVAASRDRAGWEAFAVSPEAEPIVWLADWTEVFLIHVQGSARVALPDGQNARLVYAGRNGMPYTSIGRRLIETGRVTADDMSLARLKAWLRANGEAARALMQENRSYIFFRLEPDLDPSRGPVGGQGLPLAAGCSIAVDRNLWCYGLPFWIETESPIPGFGAAPLGRLFVAQDTGSAILGPARADLFLGSGAAAGEAAGAIRHEACFTVLLPREAS